MGCYPSSFKAKTNKYDDFYYNDVFSTLKESKPSKQRGLKRNYSSRISSNTSNVSSGFSSDDCNSPAEQCSMKSKSSGNYINFQSVDSIGHTALQQQQQLNSSAGYYTGDTRSSGSSTPCRPVRTRKTRPRCSETFTLMISSSSSGTEDNVSIVSDDLAQEMFMMSNSPNLMPNTSSPIMERRDVPVIKTRPTMLYQQFRNHLQTTSAYQLNNITRLPEAIAGQFSPMNFPGFSELNEDDIAIKRFKVDVQQQQQQQQPAMKYRRTVITTEL